MTQRSLLLERQRREKCGGAHAPEWPGTLYCLWALLVMSGCGGDGVGASSTPPPVPRNVTVTGKLLYSFGATLTDAMAPSGSLIQGSDGNFYGRTYRGGLPNCPPALRSSFYDGCGTVFKITPAGVETIVYFFVGTAGNGMTDKFTAGPLSLIEASDGNFYGAASGDITTGSNGAIFKLTPQGVETILYSFSGGADGGSPSGLIQGRDGNFYGTTSAGGAATAGTFFKLTPQGTKTVLYSFGTNADDAWGPVGQLLEGTDGNFYGVAGGGLPVGEPHPIGPGGTIFVVTPQGVETVLHRFAGDSDGAYPNDGLVQASDGTLYGTTVGNPFGTVFSISSRGEERTLYVFQGGDDGDWPQAGLTQGTDGNFYGTTSIAGKNGGGTLFQVTPAGSVTPLYSFPALPPDSGLGPNTNLIEAGGNFYVASAAGGANNYGYFFQLTLQ
jgi:uncharacterized repeat protein (TIGR03803 family)